MSAKIREQWRVDWEQCEGEARPEAMGLVGVLCAHDGVAMRIMASSGGVDAVQSGPCRAPLCPGIHGQDQGGKRGLGDMVVMARSKGNKMIKVEWKMDMANHAKRSRGLV